MSYTPVELRHVHVGRSLLGYNRAAVEELIDDVAESFESTWRERGELADRVEALEKQIRELRGREELLAHTLVAAEKVASDVRDQAKRAAEAILSEAQAEARALLRQAEEHRERLIMESRRIEAMLRASLVMVEQGGAVSAPPPVPAAVEQPTAQPAAVVPAAVESAALEPVVELSALLAPATEQPASAEAPQDEAWTLHEPLRIEPAASAWEPGVAEAPQAIEPQQPVGPRLVDPEPLATDAAEDTDELDAVPLPPLDQSVSDQSIEAKSFLRRLAGGSSRDFDWGE